MAKKTDKKKLEKEGPKARVHEELRGFEVSINEFGEIRSNLNIEKINSFLNENVDDKKLLNREEPEETPKRGRPRKKK